MKKIFVASLLVATFTNFNFVEKGQKMVCKVRDKDCIKDCFPKSVQEISEWVTFAKHAVTSQLNKIIDVDGERSWANTAEASDLISDVLTPIMAGIESVVYLHPDDQMREAAQKASIEMQAFLVDEVTYNKKFYEACKKYATEFAPNEELKPTQKYFLQEELKGFERAGLNLPDEKLEAVKKLKKELADLEQQFEVNISKDARNIKVAREELGSLPESFIASLKKDGDKFILGVDYPTYFMVMESCDNSETRRKLYQEFNNRAFPTNRAVLNQVIEKRDKLAKLLGFKSYAEYNLDRLMVKSPDAANKFLDGLLAKALPKAKKEVAEWTKDLPKSVVLTEDGKLKPWDSAYLKSEYKKKHLNYDENKVKEYFPIEHTIEQLLKIYEKFFSLEFKKSKIDLWFNDLDYIEVYQDGKQIGSLVLDLYPRANKFSHACHMTILPAVEKKAGSCPALSIVIANFPKPTKDTPALLKYSDVNTFFHEFGHAVHALLGRTEMNAFAGTSVKRDFVEMPSQMLENWLNDKEILRMISCHYKTGQSLPDDLIDVMNKLEILGSGNHIARQVGLSKISLNFYDSGEIKELDTICREINAMVAPHIKTDDDAHFWAAFGHLMGYGAGYYGYLWSDVFSKDLFQKIAKQGLLNPEAGRKYAGAILAHGGSVEPDKLLRNYLEREPNQQAYLKAKGLS